MRRDEDSQAGRLFGRRQEQTSVLFFRHPCRAQRRRGGSLKQAFSKVTPALKDPCAATWPCCRTTAVRAALPPPPPPPLPPPLLLPLTYVSNEAPGLSPPLH